MTTVRVRVFAALREIAGASEFTAEGDSVEELIDALAQRYGARFGEVARAGSAVVEGERAERSRRLEGGQEVALLPPFSGG